MKASVLFLFTLAMISTGVSHAALIMFDDFNNADLGTGGPGSINGGFTPSDNDTGTGSSTEPSGTFAVLTASSGARNQGMASNNSLDLIGLPSFTVTFVVEAADDPDYNGIFLGIKDSNAATFFRTESNFGIVIGSNRYGSGDNDVVLVADDIGGTPSGFQATILEDIDFASLSDGFTASFTVNSNDTFSYNVSGITGTGTGSGNGSLTGTTYAGQFDASDYVVASIQTSGVSRSMSVDSVSVVPEPSTLALAALGLLGLISFGLCRTR